MSAVEWMLEAMSKPDEADTRKIFRLENIEFRALLNNKQGRLGFVSLNDLRPYVDRIAKEALQIQSAKAPQQRTGYEREIMHLYESLILFQRIKSTLVPQSMPNFQLGLNELSASLPGMIASIQNYRLAGTQDDTGVHLAAKYLQEFKRMSELSYAQFVALPGGDHDKRWGTVGDTLMESFRTGTIPESLSLLGNIVSACQESEGASLQNGVAEYRRWLDSHGFKSDAMKAERESYFNHAEFFFQSLLLYLGATLLGCLFWCQCSEPIRRLAVQVLLLGLLLHTAGLIFRMVLHGRPPVTNLYSSAVFVGWASVILGLVLERIYRTGMGVVVAGLVGFVTLIIAHHLSSAGDTLGVLQAVLDTNVWLATHVVIVTIGYAAMFLAGAFATVSIIRKKLDQSFSENDGKKSAQIVFGVTCFAILFSFVGTVLGGIWADQSWGRFWGWDPKENGALMIVLWCAVVLHARLAGVIRDRGMLIAALLGNVITSFSWFGVNLLGIGLHTYGFMEGAFKWLAVFITFQLLIVGLELARFRRPPAHA
jgi:ABC-type transport system involved in cytochrome c biogenesis permease subunit